MLALTGRIGLSQMNARQQKRREAEGGKSENVRMKKKKKTGHTSAGEPILYERDQGRP